MAFWQSVNDISTMKFKSIQGKLVLFVTSLILIVTLVLGALAYFHIDRTTTNEKISEISLITETKYSEAVALFGRLKNRAHKLLQHIQAECNLAKNGATETCLKSHIQMHLEIEGAKSALFYYLNLEKKIKVGLWPDLALTEIHFLPEQQAVLLPNRDHLSAPTFLIKAGLVNPAIQIIVEYPLERLSNILNLQYKHGLSIQSFLLDENGNMITHLRERLQDKSPLPFQLSAVQACFTDTKATPVITNINDSQFFASYRKFPEMGGGCLVTYQGQLNASNYLGKAKGEIIFAGLISLIVCSLFIFKFSQKYVEPIRNLALMADRISSGDFSIRSGIVRSDEIGQLAHSFDLMTQNLIAANSEVEKRQLVNLGILNSSCDVIMSTNRRGIIETVNNATENMFLYKPEDLIGQSLKILFIEPFQSRFENFIDIYPRQVTSDHVILTGEFKLYTKNKKTIEVHLRMVEVQIGEETKFIATFRDLRELYRMKFALEESERKFSLAFSSVKDFAIIMTDSQGTIKSWGSGAEKIIGYKAEEVIGQNISLFYTKKDRLAFKPMRNLNEALTKGSFEEESIRVPKNGVPFIASIVINPIWDEDKNHIGFIKVTRDITERKKLERARIEAEVANQQKTAFLASMSHEIRTPLNSIIGITEILLSQQIPDVANQQNLLKTAHAAGENLLCIINDTLDLAKIEAGALTLENLDFSLSEQIQNCISMMDIRAKAKGLQLSWDLSAGVDACFNGDPTRFRQVVLNLISNAVKFSEKGKIHLHGELIRKYDKVSELQFRVSDEGLGIPKEKLDIIFDRFSQVDTSITRRFGGTGLGLSIAKRIVEMMHGKIWVESVVGKGSIFYFSIHLVEAESVLCCTETQGINANSVEKTKTNENTKPMNILIVDDSAENRLVVKTFLKDHPHRLTMAVDGAEAIEKFKADDFDLVLMDVQMPILDGYSATKEIRKWEKEYRHRHSPIVAFTAHAFEEDIDASRAAGCDDHLTKPLKRDKLLKLISKYQDLLIV